MRLATFDIFDTTLIRRCGMPGAVQELVALRLWPDNPMQRCAYLNLRRQAAGLNASTSLADIYGNVAFKDFADYSPEEIMSAEMAVESEMLTANPIIKAKIDELREAGWEIKFLSDMYLPSEFLAAILKREGCLKGDEEVIVSCEWNARKDTGELYRKVRSAYSPQKWIHFGDNRHSDYKIARKNGVKATLVDFGFTPVEKRMNAEVPEIKDGWRVWLLTGASRAERIKNGLSPEASIAADYVAATYIPFVIWLLRAATASGIQRLHFLSRDGYIMMKIAEALEAEGIDLNYLFVSRKALTKAYLNGDPGHRFVEITDRKRLLTQHVGRLLERLQLTPEQLKQYGIKFGYDRIASPDQEKDFINKIFNNPEFTPHLLKQIEEEASLADRYLRQEGLADGVRQAMVDIGWLGTSRMMINGILGGNIPTYYVGVRADVYPRSCGDYLSYFAVGALDTAAPGLIENYFSASPWPSTIGYEEGEDGSITPRFAPGQHYQENEIINTNVGVGRQMACELKPYLDILDNEVLYKWAKISIESISTLSDDIDLTPLVKNAEFDGVPLARKLNIFELMNFTFTGARYTAFDRASVRLSTGKKVSKALCKIHDRSAKVRERLYKGYIKLRSR